MQPQCLCSPTPPTSSFTLTSTPTIFRVFVLFVLCYKHSKKKKKTWVIGTKMKWKSSHSISAKIRFGVYRGQISSLQNKATHAWLMLQGRLQFVLLCCFVLFCFVLFCFVLGRGVGFCNSPEHQC